jgi:cytochrome c oxidase subunit 3
MGPAEPVIPHHFETKPQHNECNILGMWLFLAQEIMFFGGLFTAYAVYRFKYPDAWEAGSGALNRTIGTGNTIVLLVSSLTMALSVYYAQTDQFKRLVASFSLTMVFGTVFLVVKYFEYKEKYTYGLIPGAWWNPDPHHVDLTIDDPAKIQLFFVMYFIMTGMHAFHMVIGLIIAGVMMIMTLKRKFGPNKYMPVEMFGFYWHFVDIVWVFLFPMIYLI